MNREDKVIAKPVLHLHGGMRCVTASVVLVMAMLTCPSHAADVAWRTRTFQYAAEGKALAEVLRDFGASQGLLVSVGADVDGTVKGRFDMAPQKFLDLMASSYGFSWYYNGAVLQITAARGMKSALIAMPASRVEDLERSLERMRMKDARFPLRYDNAANAAVVVGPEEYVELVRDLASQFERKRQTDGVAETRVFRLSFARAGDRTSSTVEGGRQAGVVSTLQAIYHAPKAPLPTSLLDDATMGQPRSNLRAPGFDVSEGLPAPARPNDPIVPANARPESGSLASWWDKARFSRTPQATGPQRLEDSRAVKPPKEEGEELPIIVADTAHNAVIVRDLPQRMPQHEQLIRALDERPAMVEIEVHIIDVDETALDALGVDWQMRTDRLDVRATYGSQLSTVTTGGGAPAAVGSALTVVLNNAGQYFLSRITALEQQERARVVARPRVATLNNVEALMDRKQTFQVRVAGLQTAELYSVSAGITMRVLPSISAGDQDERHIRLGVHVEDGQLLDRLVDNLPVVASSKLETQAIVRPGESLLIAGYTSEVTATGRSGVPGLSRVPGLGALFSANKVEGRRFERLFLVSPRLISP